jgi:hypothetical protein
MNFTKFFITLVFLAFAGSGCKSLASGSHEITQITDGCSLGKFFFSLDNFGEAIISNDSETMKLEAMKFEKKISFDGKDFLLIEYGVFRSPYFDWKENPRELIVHFWVAANEIDAQKAAKIRPDYYQRGKFIITATGKNCQLYIDSFRKLYVGTEGNLEISPLRIDTKTNEFPNTGLLKIVYSLANPK